MQSQAFRLVDPVAPADHSPGPPHAPVTVVEYGDFECPHCKQAAGAVKQLLAHFDERVRIARASPPSSMTKSIYNAFASISTAASRAAFVPRRRSS
ncbi:MAG: thioredoxin domain-containing protein [Pseudomonadota bacterium]